MAGFRCFWHACGELRPIFAGFEAQSGATHQKPGETGSASRCRGRIIPSPKTSCYYGFTSGSKTAGGILPATAYYLISLTAQKSGNIEIFIAARLSGLRLSRACLTRLAHGRGAVKLRVIRLKLNVYTASPDCPARCLGNGDLRGAGASAHLLCAGPGHGELRRIAPDGARSPHFVDFHR